MNRKKLVILISLFLIIIAIVSCKKQQEKPKPPKNLEQINTLDSIDEKIEEVIRSIEDLEEKIKKAMESEQQQSQGNSEGGENKQEGNKQQGNEQGQKQQEGSQQGKETQNKEQMLNKGWEKINKTIEDIHTTWNDYEVMGVEDGVSEEDITKFEETLSALTLAGEEKSFMNALTEANRLTLNLANFYDFYKSDGDSEMLKVKHYVHQIYLDGKGNKWGETEESIKKALTSFGKLKQKVELEEKDKELLDKMKLSIEDMKNVIKDKDIELVKIKRDIALKNLKAIKEASK